MFHSEQSPVIDHHWIYILGSEESAPALSSDRSFFVVLSNQIHLKTFVKKTNQIICLWIRRSVNLLSPVITASLGIFFLFPDLRPRLVSFWLSGKAVFKPWLRFRKQCWAQLVFELGYRWSCVWNLCSHLFLFHIAKDKPYSDSITFTWGSGVISYFTGATLGIVFPSGSAMLMFFSVLLWENYNLNYLLFFIKLSHCLII